MTDPTDSDITLLERIAIDRDEGALEQLLLRYIPTVKAIIESRFIESLGEVSTNEALQNASYKLWEKAGEVDPSTLAGWLIQVATNASLDILRGRKTAPATVNAIECFENRTSGQFAGVASPRARWLVSELRTFASELQGLQRKVMFADIDSGGQSAAADLADLYNTSQGSIEVTRHRVRKKFKERIAKLESQNTLSGGKS